MDLNIVTFIFFALALVIFIQLRNVLGRRTGNERRPFDPFSGTEESPAEKQAQEAEAASSAPARPYAAIDAYAPAGSALNEDLRALARADKGFDPQEFLSGARAAYEMILTAFAKNELSALKPLLADNIYKDFAEAVKERQTAGETVKFSFIGLDKAEIVSAELEGKEARLSVHFKAEIISASYDKNGKCIDGDAQEIITLRDRWGFARQTDAETPDWLLIATEDGGDEG